MADDDRYFRGPFRGAPSGFSSVERVSTTDGKIRPGGQNNQQRWDFRTTIDSKADDCNKIARFLPAPSFAYGPCGTSAKGTGQVEPRDGATR